MFQALIDFLSNPLVLKVLVGYWAYTAVVGAMPSPADVKAVNPGISPTRLLIYQFFFAALHAIAGSLSRAAVAFKLPGAKEIE